MNILQKALRSSFLAISSLFITGILLVACVFFYMYIGLPDVSSLRNTQLQVPLSVYTNDGKLIAEYGEVRRIPVSLDQIPKKLVQAILATEDQRYFEHPGVDLIGLLRAAKEVAITGKPTQGASTITMQVARNFFLSRQKTFGRKFNEILLALKIDATLSKEKVLELYLNKIYLGQRAYGVAAAAQVYFGKTLNELTLPEIATLAGLPQAPSRDNPISNPKAALERRNHVLERMLENGYINHKTYEQGITAPLTAHYHGQEITVDALYVAEMVRSAIVEAYGDEAYTSGLKVYTTIDSQLQSDANKALRNGLVRYDQRHGYHGPEKHFNHRRQSNWLKELQTIPVIGDLQPAIVLDTNYRSVSALLANGRTANVPRKSGFRFRPGDVIRLKRTADKEWELGQIPKVEGALIALNPMDGSILALEGGFSFAESPYNRVTQAMRQPGSSFKPFIYSAALEKGFSLASVIDDAPLTFVESDGTVWQPHNANNKFYGPTRLRAALVHSRNLVSIRLLQTIGIPYAVNYMERFGFTEKALPRSPSLALGTGVLTPLQLAAGYAVFANGGYRIKPYFIHHIEDNDGKIIYKTTPFKVCENCSDNETTNAPRIITAQNAYLITNVLQDVIKSGTGRRALALQRGDIAGKTGTTSKHMDTWFAGFNSDIVTTVWMGYDQPQSINEFAADSALPIWIDFMRSALNGKPEHTLPQPPGIISVRIDSGSGLLSYPDENNAIYELFDEKNVPNETANPDMQATRSDDSQENNFDNGDDDSESSEGDETENSGISF